MTKDDLLDLLAIVAASDHRKSGDAEIAVWNLTIGHLEVAECMDAVMAHRREQPGVWLEPGHVLQRVRNKRRDKLDRADPDERAAMLTTAAGVRRDSFGAIDKGVKNLDGEDDYPEHWTPEQRTAAYWDRVRAHRDGVEYEMGRSGSPKLLKHRPAPSAARAAVMAAFAEKQFGVEADGSAPRVDPMSVACPFCKAKVRSTCTVASEAQPLRSVVAHPSRLELAAQEAGYPKDVVDRIVGSAQRRQTNLVQSAWSERDKGVTPVTHEGADA